MRRIVKQSAFNFWRGYNSERDLGEHCVFLTPPLRKTEAVATTRNNVHVINVHVRRDVWKHVRRLEGNCAPWLKYVNMLDGHFLNEMYDQMDGRPEPMSEKRVEPWSVGPLEADPYAEAPGNGGGTLQQGVHCILAANVYRPAARWAEWQPQRLSRACLASFAL